MSEPIKNRYEFVLFFDVENGNPNGDPDAGNMPRIDPETSNGIVTDVCLKRKVRNYVQIAAPRYENEERRAQCKVFVEEKVVLNTRIEEAYLSEEVKLAIQKWEAWKKEVDKKNKACPEHYEDVAKRWMCENYFDIRAFGAVLSTGDSKKDDESTSKIKKTAGQVQGPVQLTFAKSIDPICPTVMSITRMAVTNEKDLAKERTMGRKHTVPYGLYRAEGYVSANFAQKTGFSEDDLALLWEALENMFDHDHSAARGKMAARKLIVFKHDCALGNAPAHKLFDLVTAKPKPGITGPTRSFADYEIEIDEANKPEKVEIIKKF